MILLRIIYVISVLYLLCFSCVYLLMPCGHLLGKAWPLAHVYDALLWSCHFPIGILGQVWCLVVSIPDLCPLSHFDVAISLYLSVCFFLLKKDFFRRIILAHRIRISEIIPWDRKSYLTHAILPRLSREGYIHWLYWNSRILSSSDVIVMLMWRHHVELYLSVFRDFWKLISK